MCGPLPGATLHAALQTAGRYANGEHAMTADLEATSSGFGDVLRRYRVAAGLTQETLAERAGLSVRGLSDLERGIHAAPRKHTLLVLVNALALNPPERAALLAAARDRPTPAVARASRTTARGTRENRFPGAPLPIPTDRFIGRELDIAAITSLLRDPATRLVTLTGPGGTGKTRLTIQVAHRLQTNFPDGIAFISLAAIRDHTLVAASIAQALGVREGGDLSAEDGLVTALGTRRVLLVLDNFEHVLPAAPVVSRILVACPNVQIVATSRVALRLSGEQRFPVAPLDPPHPTSGLGGAHLRENPAVRLFVQRARQVRPDFALTPDNASDIAMICRRLDGLPLAIELAATRIAVLPPQALLARMERMLPLLSGGARDQPERLQTMRDAISWSYDLLPAEVQHVFRQLVVFEGGFTLDAAEAVCQIAESMEDVPFNAITTLVEASLLQAQSTLADEPRYFMLETIREYGLELLAASGEEDWLRARHAAWVLAFAEASEPHIFRAAQQIWWRRIESERPNIRAALAWFEQTGDPAGAQQLAGVLTPFQWTCGHLREGQDWLRRALAIPGETSATALARATWGSAVLAWFQGAYDEAWTLAERAGTVAQEGNFPLGVAMSLHARAISAWMMGDAARAIPVGVEAIARMRDTGHTGLLAILLCDMGMIALQSGDRERGSYWVEEGFALNRQLGNWWFIANYRSDLGFVAQSQGDLARAVQHYRESIRLFRDLDVNWYLASPLAGLAAMAVADGRAEAAARLLGVAAALRETSGFKAWSTEQKRDAQSIAEASAALGVQAFEHAAEAGRALHLEEAVTEAIAIADSMAATLAIVPG